VLDGLLIWYSRAVSARINRAANIHMGLRMSHVPIVCVDTPDCICVGGFSGLRLGQQKGARAAPLLENSWGTENNLKRSSVHNRTQSFEVVFVSP
jgi:hypothetical protein